jgi:Zn ribbon nucleic-acid-binding protein
MSGIVQNNSDTEDKPLQGLKTACDLPFDVLSGDLEYPPCPDCDKNSGLFTQVSENSDHLHCVKCGAKFGDICEVITTRELPRPIRDDFVACIVAGVSPQDQANIREVNVGQVMENLNRAAELLCRDWVAQWKEDQDDE